MSWNLLMLSIEHFLSFFRKNYYICRPCWCVTRRRPLVDRGSSRWTVGTKTLSITVSLNDGLLLLSTVEEHLITSLRDLADKHDVIGDSLHDVTVGVVSVAVAACALMLTTQLIEAVLLRLVALTLPWKRRRLHDDNISSHHHHQHQQQQQQQCANDWQSTYAQFDDVTETCSPQQRNVIMFDLSSGFAETNV